MNLRKMKIVKLALVTLYLCIGATAGYSHTERELSDGCEYDSRNLDLQNLLSDLTENYTPCIVVEIDDRAWHKGIFYFPEVDIEIVCTIYFDPTTGKGFIDRSVRYLHITKLLDIYKDYQLIVRSCGLYRVSGY